MRYTVGSQEMHSLFPKHDLNIFLDTPSEAIEPVSFLPCPPDTPTHLRGLF